jgi:cytochrome c biogenesis protein CcmG, thiol:disulfide interchange protein DsbE
MLRRRGSLAWLLLIAALGVTLAALALIPLVRAPDDGRIGSLVGSPAPALTGTTLAGEPWSLADALDPADVVWVNFWATSCEPCRTEMPAMQRIADAYGDELAIVGVDWGEGVDAVASFIERYGVTYDIVMDPNLENYYRWAHADGLPRHYFVGRDGTVVREVVGPLEPAAMVEILEELLGEPPA